MAFNPCTMTVVAGSIPVCVTGILATKMYLQLTFGTPYIKVLYY